MTDLSVRGWRHAAETDCFAARSAKSSARARTSRNPLGIARSRLIFASAAFALLFAVLSARLVDVSLVPKDSADVAIGGDAAALTIERADIVDRNGALVATNLPARSLFVDPARVLDPNEAAEKLAAVLPDVSRDEVFQRATTEKRFAWVKRYLTPDQHYEVNRLGLPGFGFKREERRVYPHGALFAHAIGFTSIDNRGLAGLEAALDDNLRAHGAASGAPVELAMDLRVQHALTEELSAAMTTFNALGAAGIVLDVDTAEVIAMVSLPGFEPNEPESGGNNGRFNRATLGVYELGSTFKAFTAAMALDYGVVTLSDGYDATEPLRVARHVIRDEHPQKRWLTVPEILVHSSNIGAAQMALDVGTKRQQAFLAKFGMLDSVGLEVIETGRPLLPNRWGEINTMTIGFGHGIAVTPLHLVNGFAALVNGGVLRTPTLLRRPDGPPAAGRRVIRQDTSELMRRLMRLTVVEGTGGKADAPGYLVGGKTGTAEKAVAGRYDRDSLISTFVGAFPMNAPRYAVLGMLDEPKGNASTHGFATAGWTAAPLVGRVISRIAPLLGVAPVDVMTDVPAPAELVAEVSGGSRSLASF